jgi:stage II sporulation protein D
MNGHGVGMSNADAGQRASKDGWNYLQILKHYYTGVEVEKVF